MITEEEKRIRLIRAIAASRFPFIDQEDWPSDWTTITNDRANIKAVEGPEGKIYPSIVVVDSQGEVKEIGQVETDESLTLAHVDRWMVMSSTTEDGRGGSRLFIFVPEGKSRTTQKLLEDNGVKYAGIRTWAVKQGQLTVKLPKTTDKQTEPDPVKLIKKTYMRTQDEMKIYLIDGEFFRDNLDIDFTVGGHYWVYPFIPRDEVWLDVAYTNEPKAVEYFLAHELEEIKHMKKGMKYEEAHALANKLEKELRDKLERGVTKKPTS